MFGVFYISRYIGCFWIGCFIRFFFFFTKGRFLLQAYIVSFIIIIIMRFYFVLVFFLFIVGVHVELHFFGGLGGFVITRVLLSEFIDGG